MSEIRINWFPGHMAKSVRELEKQLKRVDLVLEICDARLPFSSRNPDLIRMIGSKPHILFLNKADLAEPEANRQWIRRMKEDGCNAQLLTAVSFPRKKILQAIDEETEKIVSRAAVKGVRKTVRTMVVGIPNTGKSTFVNRLAGSGTLKVGDRPGVTRASQWIRISPYLEMLDTPGLLWPRLEDQQAARRLCYIGSISDDAVPLAEVTESLLRELSAIDPQRLAERFHLRSSEDADQDWLERVCTGRGWLLKGGVPDYERCCRIVLDEFRAGKLGRITLEWPTENSKVVLNHERPDAACTEPDSL